MRSLVFAAVFAVLALLFIGGYANASGTYGPTISISAPANNSTNYFNYTNFTYKPLDDGRITSCSLYVNHTQLGYTISVANNTDNTFGNIPIPDNGTYYWYISCTNNLTYSRSTREWFFIVSVDKTPPTVTINTKNSSVNQSGTAIFTYNVTDMASGPASCKLIVDNTVMANTSGPVNNSVSTFLISLAIGTYTWSVNCTDKNLNEGTSGPALVEPATPTAPVIAISGPANNTITSTNLINFSYTPSSPENLYICRLFLNNSINQSVLNPLSGVANSFSNVKLHDGWWRWWINCTGVSGKDTASGIYSLNISTLTLLSNYLVVVAKSPAEAYYDRTGSPSFSYKASSVSNITSCMLITNNSIREISRNVPINANSSFNNVDLGDGVWSWRIECKNSRDLIVSTELRTLTVSRAIGRSEIPIEADVTIPGLETPLDLSEINKTVGPNQKEVSRVTFLEFVIVISAGLSLFVFVISHPIYKARLERMLGIGRVMAIEQLKFYIDQNLRKGISEERIRRHLKKYNWDAKDIDEVFKAVYAEMQAELKAKKLKDAGK